MSSAPVPFEVGVAGFYKFEAFRADDVGNEIPGSRRVVADWFPNLITNLGLNGLMANTGGSSLIGECYVGSGSAPPAETDTALVEQVATSSSIQSDTNGYSTVAPYYCWRRVVYRFQAGEAAGNLSEVGVGTSGSSLFSRALIVDGNGDPTTITVLPDEVLDVTYEIRAYVPTDDAVYTINSGGIDYTFTVRAARAGTSSWGGRNIVIGLSRVSFIAYPATSVIGAITAQPSEASVGGPTTSNMWTDTASNLSNTFRIILGLGDANATGGIGAFMIKLGNGVSGDWMHFQVQCSPALPKDATKTMTMDFTLSLARVTP